MKKCSKCQVDQDISFFGNDSKSKDGLKSVCKLCRNTDNKKYRTKNPLSISEYHKKLYLEKRDNILEKNRLWLSINKEKKNEIDKKYREEKKELISECGLKYRNNNKEKILQYQKKYKEKNKEKIKIKNEIPFNKFKHNIRSRISKYFKIKNLRKDNKTFDIVGCSPEFLKEYIEKQFIVGMSWDKMGKHIHIDHIIPLSSAKNEEDIYKLCHYTNLQPLWAEDNLKKSSKYDESYNNRISI